MKQTFLLGILAFLPFLTTASPDEDSIYLVLHYTKAEYQIPMRDGIKLYTIVYSPRDKSQKYPILLNRTPYNIAPYGKEMKFSFRRGLFPGYLREGFIFVFQDVRGRFMSEGVFQHMTPFIENKTSKTEVDESSDAYDTMDWLIKNLDNNNGRVGIWGISYPGYYASCAAINAHPALKCVSPQAPIADWYFDDVHHRGAFYLAANFDFFAEMDLPRHGFTKTWTIPYHWNTPDGYDFYMNLGPLRNASLRYFGDSIDFWNKIVTHPNYDDFWQKRNILPHLNNIKPAMLVVGGWYDAEDLYGTFKTHENIVRNNPGNACYFVIGPWIHGGWARTDGSFLGNVSFTSKTSLFYQDSIELPFFNYYLKDKGILKLPKASMFLTGKNEWKKFDKWPPANVEIKKLYLGKNGGLSFVSQLPDKSSFDEFISDPQKPVPYTEDITFGMTKEYMTDDQRFAARRPDVLSYKTDVLLEDITFAGPLIAHLQVSTSESDADWVVKLIDVYPDNASDNPSTRKEMKMGAYQQMIRSEVIRGRYRNSYVQPLPFEPNKIEPVIVELQDVLHCFKKGHKIMVQIQSSWFPLVDVNPQKYVDNIYEAGTEAFRKAIHRVYHQLDNESYLEIGILKPEASQGK
jgi:uncharacterized protein